MYVYHVHSWAPGGQKIPLGPLELELEIAMHHHVDAENRAWILRQSMCSPTPQPSILISHLVSLSDSIFQVFSLVLWNLMEEF